jgi:5'-AMP-activated protein kinase catalytic alpha subunit
MFHRRSTTTTAPPSPETRMSNGTIISTRYRLERTIGKGSYGKVKLAVDLQTGQRVAIKFIARSSIRKPAHTIRIRREINLLTALFHGNIVGLYGTLETVTDIILVMEYVEGADLFERIVGHADQRYPEDEARPIFEQIVAAMEYCHQHRVVHRDLKPENVMVDSKGQVKLIDFGFANMYHPRGFLETNCGSPLYAAPEIVQGVRYIGPEVDVWSLGVILFAILTGTLPFEDEQLKGLYSKICAGTFTMPNYLSTGAKDLIRSMLNTDPRQRITISQVARHPWLRGFQPLPKSFSRLSVTPHPLDRILQAMVGFGFTDVEATRMTIRTDPDDPATSIYHLLLQKEQRETLDKPVAVVTPPPTPSKRLASPLYDAWINIPDLTPIIQSPPLEIATPPPEAGFFTTPSSIVSQAAATVANHFKKLRGINLLPKSQEEYKPVGGERQEGGFFHV